MTRATPEAIAAAWAAWHSRHGGKLGPGPAFVEAINAALEKLETPAMTEHQEKEGHPAPVTHVTGLEPVGEIDAGGTLKWFKPPIRKGTVLYAGPGSTLAPEEIECVCKRAVCTYDADFGCGLDRSKERHDA